MSLSVGTRLGPYEIVAAIGAGGMGEVYRARDTKLGRDVAIKILPGAFSGDSERLARFDREARLLAALNHPHIGAIYGVEDTGQAPALVLELIEGPTLADRISSGALPVAEALTIASQIAGALDAAHEKGIVHRDLKPANVKVTTAGLVKVLDFGLAKAHTGQAPVDPSDSPTVTVEGTLQGVILGTAAYMSPEQARGMPVDRRTDVWAFGCVLFEMLTGRKAFGADTVSDTIAVILQREPDWDLLPRSTPAKIRHLLQRCLQKDAARRLRDVGDARIEIEDARAVTGNSRRGPTMRKAAGLVAIAAALGAAGVWSLRPDPPAQSDRATWVRLTNFPDSVGQPALSPDGRMLAFVRGLATFYTAGQVYVKMLPDGEPKQITDDAQSKMSPVFSPDGSRIAYTTVNENGFRWNTWIVPVLGGEPRLWLSNASGLTWMPDRRLLFSEIKNSQMHMAVVASDESRATSKDMYVPARENGMAHRSYASPDGRSLLLAEMDGPWLPCRLVPADGSSPGKPVGPPGATCTSAAWSPDGRWMFLTSSAGGATHIWRQRFPDGVPEQVTSGPTEEDGIAMAADGRSFVTAVGLRQRSVLLHEKNGERQISTEGYALRPMVSSDGKSLCYFILKGTSVGDPLEAWCADLASGRSDQLLPGFSPIGFSAMDMSPDGKQAVIAARDRDNNRGLWIVSLDRQSPPRQLPVKLNVDRFAFWRREGVFFYVTEGDSGSVYRVRPDGTGLQRAIVSSVSQIQGVSPDGRWVVTFAGATSAYPVEGGSPVTLFGDDIKFRWSSDGRLLFVMHAVGQAAGVLGAAGRTYVVPLEPGKMLPPVPERGFPSFDDVARLPGVWAIESADVGPGLTPDVYAFSRETTQRNLYRVPIP